MLPYPVLLSAINAAIPGIVQIVHIFTDSDTGVTIVNVLERAKGTAKHTEDIIKAWNDLHPQTQP